jgi:hypothetical protein
LIKVRRSSIFLFDLLRGPLHIVCAVRRADKGPGLHQVRIYRGTKDEIQGLVSQITTFVRTPKKLDVIKEDSSDNRILECALAADVDFIISGDVHLLSLEKLGRIKIVSARDLLEADYDTG